MGHYKFQGRISSGRVYDHFFEFRTQVLPFIRYVVEIILESVASGALRFPP